MSENRTAYELTRRVLTDEGVRFEAMEAAMRIYRIPVSDRADTSDRVLIMAGRFLKRKREEAEKGRNA